MDLSPMKTGPDQAMSQHTAPVLANKDCLSQNWMQTNSMAAG